MFDTEGTEAATGLLDFLGGGTPPAFEEYGAEALRAGPFALLAGSTTGSHTPPLTPACTTFRLHRAGRRGRRTPPRA